MQPQDITELFVLQNVLSDVLGSVDAPEVTDPRLLAALLDWKRAGPVTAPASEPARSKRPSRPKGKTAQPESSDDDEPEF
jgi:hypothetical protein